jgi:hypothetical protein
MHTAELQHRLIEARGIDEPTKEGRRIKPYTASSRFNKDVESL